MYSKEKQYKIAMILLCPVQGPWASSFVVYLQPCQYRTNDVRVLILLFIYSHASTEQMMWEYLFCCLFTAMPVQNKWCESTYFVVYLQPCQYRTNDVRVLILLFIYSHASTEQMMWECLFCCLFTAMPVQNKWSLTWKSIQIKVMIHIVQ